MSQLDSFPRTLGAEDQALFALGYYQQKWDRSGDADDEPYTRRKAEAAA